MNRNRAMMDQSIEIPRIYERKMNRYEWMEP